MRLLPLLPALAIVYLTACKNEPAKDQPSTPAPASTGNNPEGVARLLFERFNQHDWEGMAALYTDTAEFKDPSFGKGIVKQTRAETVKKYKELNALFTNFRDSVIGVYPSGDNYVTVEFISKGTAPDGTLFELPICTILTVENGFIRKDFTYYDNEQ
jgi:ketosteroid isomerase-like protein